MAYAHGGMLAGRASISPARLEDLAALEALEKECEAYFSFDPPSPNNRSTPIRRCLLEGDVPPGGNRENYHLFCVCMDGALVGFVDYHIGHPHDRAAYLSSLYIARRQREDGLGTEIVGALIERFAALGMEEIRLHVSLRNTTALAFWVKMGFDQIMGVQCEGNLLPGAFAGIELRRMIVREVR